MVEFVVGGATRVIVGSGVIDAPTLLGDSSASSCGVVIQPGAAELGGRVVRCLEEAGVRTTTVGVPDGEAAKTLATVEEACRVLSDGGLTRDDLVVGVGGGAATDLTGFVAAVFLRGIRAHLVPTTLLGAVDAAVGGKSGVDVAGKNLVGVFRHPARVVIDLEVISALPEHLIRHGLAEALKAGLVGDEALVALLERDGVDADIGEVVTRSLAVKAALVARDFDERGERAHLNYGHTVGHALEAVTGIPHGEAVAIGMVAAGRASALVAGFDAEERQRDAIIGLGLPITAPPTERHEALDMIQRDKKRGRDGTRMVLLEAVGRPVVRTVGSATVDAALAAVGIPEGDS